MHLDPGDTLVVFSDGVTEAMNCDDEEFGEGRLLCSLRANGDLPLPRLLESVLGEVRQFSSGVGQSDDLTVLVVRYCGA